MTVGITGASGTIGTGLAESLRADGIAVRRFVRRPARTPDEISWDPQGRSIDTAALESAGLTAVVHLAGAGVGDRRWTASYKDEILSSRVAGTETLAKALAGLPRRVALISGSAIGYYGDTGTAYLPRRCRGPLGVGHRGGDRRGLAGGIRPNRFGGVPLRRGIRQDGPHLQGWDRRSAGVRASVVVLHLPD